MFVAIRCIVNSSSQFSRRHQPNLTGAWTSNEDEYFITRKRYVVDTVCRCRHRCQKIFRRRTNYAAVRRWFPGGSQFLWNGFRRRRNSAAKSHPSLKLTPTNFSSVSLRKFFSLVYDALFENFEVFLKPCTLLILRKNLTNSSNVSYSLE